MERKFLREHRIVYKRTRVPQPKAIGSSKDVFNICKELYGDDCQAVESAYLITLNNENKVISAVKLFVGGMDCCVIDNRVIVTHLIADIANKCILVHNHPSGNMNPSKQDERVTESLYKGLE